MSEEAQAIATAVKHYWAGRRREAEELGRQIVAAEPGCVEAWHLLAVLATEQGRSAEAAECLERVIALRPSDAAAYNNLGNIHRENDRFEAAIACYRRGIELAPGIAQIHNNLGVALRDAKAPQEAVQSLRQALAIAPDYFEAHNNLGNALKDQGLTDEAVRSYRRAAELQPKNVMVLDNLGLALMDAGRLDEAADCFRRSRELDPAAAHGHWCQSLLMLLRGDLEHGWAEHEWRWQCPEWRRYCRMPAASVDIRPVWDGSRLDGKTILLRAEQGLGDTLQFIRYAPLVKQAGGTVIVECQPTLVALLANCGADRIVPNQAERPAFDVWAALMTLPAIFKTALATIPSNVPYLFADSALVAQWQERLDTLCGARGAIAEQGPHGVRGLHIGINWRGRPEPGVHRLRDIPVERFVPLAAIQGANLINLQRDLRAEEKSQIDGRAWWPGEDVDRASGGFMDTAAIMKNLDLVITSDTAIAHLAGALGVPVWVALPFAADWRWLLNRGDSPWYPTMRLFRQKRAGDWVGVFEEIEGELRGKLGAY